MIIRTVHGQCMKLCSKYRNYNISVVVMVSHRNDDDHKKVISKILKVPQLQVGTDSEGEIDEIFFIWPTTLVTNTSSCSSYI